MLFGPFPETLNDLTYFLKIIFTSFHLEWICRVLHTVMPEVKLLQSKLLTQKPNVATPLLRFLQ